MTELPESVKKVLAAGTLPADLRLKGWLGPTLFTSEIGAGESVPRLDAFLDLEAGADNPFVLGSVRETQLLGREGPVRYAAFVVSPSADRVSLVDLETEEKKFASSSLSQLVACLSVFAREWEHLSRLEPEEVEPFLEWLRDKMSDIDPQIFVDENDYWSSWMEILEEEHALG